MQYYPNPSGIIRSFNYGASPNAMVNSVGVEGSRQIANLNYGICIAAQSGSCSITYSPLSSDPYSFTLSGDVGGVEATMLGSSTLQSQACASDYVIIPDPSQTGTPLTSGSDRFCGLGLTPTTSNSEYLINISHQTKVRSLFLGNVQPFVLYAVTDANETLDIGNRGFALAYAQNPCPVVSLA